MSWRAARFGWIIAFLAVGGHLAGCHGAALTRQVPGWVQLSRSESVAVEVADVLGDVEFDLGEDKNESFAGAVLSLLVYARLHRNDVTNQDMSELRQLLRTEVARELARRKYFAIGPSTTVRLNIRLRFKVRERERQDSDGTRRRSRSRETQALLQVADCTGHVIEEVTFSRYAGERGTRRNGWKRSMAKSIRSLSVEIVDALVPHQVLEHPVLAKGGRLVRRGNRAARRNHWAKAEAYWKTAAAERPNAGAQLNLALAAERRGDFASARTHVRTALETEHTLLAERLAELDFHEKQLQDAATLGQGHGGLALPSCDEAVRSTPVKAGARVRRDQPPQTLERIPVAHDQHPVSE